MFIKQPFDEFLGFQYKRINETDVTVTLPVQPLFLNSIGVIHGGILSTLADVAMCNTFEAGADNQQTIVTVDLKVTFIKGARGDVLTAHASQIKKGRTLSHAECKIYDDKDNLVASASGIFASVE